MDKKKSTIKLNAPQVLIDKWTKSAKKAGLSRNKYLISQIEQETNVFKIIYNKIFKS